MKQVIREHHGREITGAEGPAGVLVMRRIHRFRQLDRPASRSVSIVPYGGPGATSVRARSYVEIFALLLLCSVTLGRPSQSNAQEPDPIAWELAFLGNVDIDEGERNLNVTATVDWTAWRSIFVHAGLSFEERISSFQKRDTAVGIGYRFAIGRSSLPMWLGPGITSTGLWERSLERGHLRLGAGYRYHATDALGLAISVEHFVYDEAHRTVTLFGFVFDVRNSD